MLYDAGGQGERDDDEGGTDVELPSVRRRPQRLHSGQLAALLPADLRSCDERRRGGGAFEGELARGRLCEVREVHRQNDRQELIPYLSI